MIGRWFARMVRVAFNEALTRAEMKGYEQGRKAGYADGLDRGFDKWVGQTLRSVADIERGGAERVGDAIRGPASARDYL